MSRRRNSGGCLSWAFAVSMLVLAAVEVPEAAAVAVAMGALAFLANAVYDRILDVLQRRGEYSLSSIDTMDGHDFEYFTARLLRDLGYNNVQVTRASGDYGVDVIAYSGGAKRVFQCKRTTKKLGIKPVQEVYTGKIHYGASVAVVVTNSYFSANAGVLAKETGVVLWDRDTLKHLMRKVEKERDDKRQKRIDRTRWCCDKLENSFTWMRERLQDAAGEIERRNKRRALWKTFYGTEGHDMAAIIGAGRYVFGEDLPVGKYSLKALSGDGGLEFQVGEESGGTVPTKWMSFGTEDDCARSYYGLSLRNGWWFELEGDVTVEISRAKPIEIDEERNTVSTL